MSGPPYNRRHDVGVVSEGVTWDAICMTCEWSSIGWLRFTDAEDKADEHALNPPERAA